MHVIICCMCASACLVMLHKKGHASACPTIILLIYREIKRFPAKTLQIKSPGYPRSPAGDHAGYLIITHAFIESIRSGAENSVISVTAQETVILGSR